MRFSLCLQIGCPTWIRTTTKGSKDLCATITPSDKKADTPGQMLTESSPQPGLSFYQVQLRDASGCKESRINADACAGGDPPIAGALDPAPVFVAGPG